MKAESVWRRIGRRKRREGRDAIEKEREEWERRMKDEVRRTNSGAEKWNRLDAS